MSFKMRLRTNYSNSTQQQGKVILVTPLGWALMPPCSLLLTIKLTVSRKQGNQATNPVAQPRIQLRFVGNQMKFETAS
ncbi:hypothetical protein MJO28_009044 [Puccinia striiformis f. sp. tritici]|uniref:Uncharacterized protein n=1 Tax=Puccinia striiformis f. sp. tritici TaxID=168172 RepID=A0ACC0EDI3_9BASI|nr:hypothetical protein MJO28_009044 [Puccinia striiformis f. sp. tritici]